MALPSLNTAPSYELIIPSTQKKYNYRPFLVKEQKILMLAYESQDKKQIINAMLDTIKSCIPDIDVRLLTTSDVDYIFTQLRAKSVGEKAEKVVELTDKISVKLKYPTYFDFMNNLNLESSSQTEALMEVVVSCIDSIMTEEENISVKDEPKEEVIKFIESMSSQQFELISEFVQNIPQIEYTTSFKCANCGNEQEVKLQGLDDFF
jgi:predicted house-cleaning NTP pyrophosphatase (Maf/HAM1 superfamily)